MSKLLDVIDEISTEKSIPKDAVLECLKKAFIAGYRNYIYKSEGATKDARKKDKTQEVKAELIIGPKNRLILEVEKTIVKKPDFLPP